MPRKNITDDVKKQKHKSVKARINRYIEDFKSLLDVYERDHPHWRSEALLWLIEQGLVSLRHYVEAGSERQVTWDSPFVELHYPIDWNWKLKQIDTGHLTDANTQSKKIAVATLARLLVKHLSVWTLQEFTNNAGFEKRGTNYIPMLGRDVGNFIAGIKGKKKREQALRRLFHPFSMGAGLFDVDPDSLTPNAPVPTSVAKALAESTELMLPPLTWTGNINEHSFKILLIFQIHPFVIDVKNKSAHFPLTFGLQFLPSEELDGEAFVRAMEDPWLNPKTWSKCDREKLWEGILESLRGLSKDLVPTSPPEIAEAVVSIAAQIKVVSKGNDAVETEAAINKMLHTLKQTGQLLKWDCETSPFSPTVKRLSWSKLTDHNFERLLFNLVSVTPGYENPEWLTHTNAPDKGRDISVTKVVHDPLSGTRQVRIVIQCKHKTSVGIAEVSQLREQMVLWEPPRVDELIIATTGRFSSDAVQWIEKHNQSNSALRILMWPESQMERLLAKRPRLVSEFCL